MQEQGQNTQRDLQSGDGDCEPSFRTLVESRDPHPELWDVAQRERLRKRLWLWFAAMQGPHEQMTTPRPLTYKERALPRPVAPVRRRCYLLNRCWTPRIGQLLRSFGASVASEMS
jgi:hypothetical protein